MKLTSIPQINDELYSFYVLLLLVKNHKSFPPKNSTLTTAGMTNYKHPVWGRKKKKEIVCLSLWKCGCMLHFLPFLLVRQTKLEGGRGNGSTSNETASEIQSWKDVPTDERQREDAAQFLLRGTRYENIGHAKSVSLHMAHQGISRLQNHYCIYNNSGICLCPWQLASM